MTAESSGQEPRPEYPDRDDEIDLADLARVIYRRRWIIVGVTILVTLGVIAYTFTLPRVYQFQAAIQIGELPAYKYPVELELGGLQITDRSRHFIEAPQDVVSRIKQLDREDSRMEDEESTAEESGVAIDPSILKKVTVTADKETGIVELELRSSRPDASGGFLNAILERIIREHEKLLEDEKQIRHSDIEMAETELRWLENEPDNLQQELQFLDERQRGIEEYLQNANAHRDQLHEAYQAAIIGNTGEPTAALLITLINDAIEKLERRAQELHRALTFEIPERRRVLRDESHKLSLRITTARQQLDRTRQALDEATPTRIVEPPAATGKLVSPNYSLNIVLGIVLGGFLSLFVAFLVEFWSNNKHKITDS